MKKYLVIFGILTGISLSINLSTAAQDDTAADVDEALEYTYGSVVAVSPTQITISEYNYETDEEVQTSYAVDAETKVTNAASVQDLVKDDNVDVYYKVTTGDQKIAKMITKDDTAYDNESEAGPAEDEAINAETWDDSLDAPAILPIENKIDLNASRG